ncbi:MAG: ribosome biogenesis factor YjgA, partial [Betaproteobacteria bacterium]
MRPEPAANDERPSKSERKREMQALQDLGVELAALPASRLAALDLPEPLREAFADLPRITQHEARRRHLQLIGKLMRSVDPAPIQEALDQANGKSRVAVALLHRCERLRDALLADDAALTTLLDEHPGLDAQPLRALIRSARREHAAGNPPRHARALYRTLHELLQTTA